MTVNQIPAHSHPLLASSSASSLTDPGGNVSAQSAPSISFRPARGPPRWRRSPSRPTGGSQPHTNFQPYLCVNFIISLFGIFPSPT